MVSLKIILLILLCLFGITVLYAQENEQVDTTTNEHACWHKTAKIAGVAVPSLMVAYGVSSFYIDGIRHVDYNIQSSIADNNAFWHTHVDDYLQFAPAAAAFTMKLAGVKSKNKLGGMVITYGLSNLLMGGIVTVTKHTTGRERPDGSNTQSFPSGHTATAFVAAEFLHQEFGEQSVWISVSGYAAASFIGVARIYNNKHWFSDVVAGAGIGILSTKAIYWVYPHLQNWFCKKDKNHQAFVYPTYVDGRMCLGFLCKF